MKEEKSMSQSSLPKIDAMYESMNSKHKEWGLEFYKVTPKYFDPRRDKENRANVSKAKIKVKPGNKGHFLDGIMKQSCSPGPNKYNTAPGWLQAKPKNSRALVNRSFIDQIFFEEAKHKFPAPNSYNVLPTREQTEAKLKKLKEKKTPRGSDRVSFLNTVEYQSLKSPGPGNYNPHEVRSPMQKNRFPPQQMIKNYREREKKIKERLAQSKSFNYNPIVPKTFAEKMQLPKYFQQNKTTAYKKDWKPKKSLSKSMVTFPAANHYNLTQDWSSKSGIFKSLSNINHSVSVYR